MSESSSNSRILRVGQAIALFFAGVLGLSLGSSLWIGAAPALGVAERTTAYQIASTVVRYLGFVVPVALFVVAAGDRDLLSGDVPDRREALLAIGAVVALYVGQIAILWAFSLIDVAPSRNPALDPEVHAPAYFLLMIPVSLLVVGPAEELLVRGGLQGVLRKSWGPWPSIVGASALFGSLHYIGGGSGALAYVAFSFLLGILLGYLYERTGNLIVPAVAHGGYNAALYAIQYGQVA
ncbi:CPBP family intramembrane metalloprotease [Halolamina sp. CBA1230]|uniref:CPBP family intramembrane glutamic endopeptidase n=1 Tax=Halolamina sp. CBA1230 TaxID=1853690 RepID=UPI0009A237AD|nr:type II CAAX endopeptidase family protein [Halolamina sp. CBA1230]QKY20931.1 CPBP family intramembrane metalloprotease [Halolamina sp. CBA1230]